MFAFEKDSRDKTSGGFFRGKSGSATKKNVYLPPTRWTWLCQIYYDGEKSGAWLSALLHVRWVLAGGFALKMGYQETPEGR